MMRTSEIRNLTSLSKDARRTVAGAFSALAQWRDEVVAANERYVKKAVDQMAAAQRTMGWPEQAIAGAREQLLKTAKVQANMIDQIMDAWERQLKSRHDPAGVPKAFMLQMPALSERIDPMPDMMRMGEMALVPFKLWIRAAEAWQRNWAEAMTVQARPPTRRPMRRPRVPARRRPRSR